MDRRMQDHRPSTSDRAAARAPAVAAAADEDAFADVKSAVLAKLTLAVGKDPSTATSRDGSLPTASVSLASTALLTSAKASSSAAAATAGARAAARSDVDGL